jgi:hypothetical protein
MSVAPLNNSLEVQIQGLGGSRLPHPAKRPRRSSQVRGWDDLRVGEGSWGLAARRVSRRGVIRMDIR